jgi:hypothetical protein
MIPSPFRFEAQLSPEEFQKIGQLSLQWSHIENIIGTCLRVMQNLSEDEAATKVFRLPLDQRLKKMSKLLAELKPLNPEAKAAFDELKPVMDGIRYVRNNVAHAIVGEDDSGHVFLLRSKKRSLTKAEIFSAEELTNYAAHLVLALRYALGVENDPSRRWPMPDRPEIPEFLRSTIQAADPRSS